MRYAPLIRNLAGIVGGIALSASAGTAFAQSVPAAPVTTAQSAASPDILMAQIDVPTYLIVRVGAFEENDPAVAKIVTALPYYTSLP